MSSLARAAAPAAAGAALSSVPSSSLRLSEDVFRAAHGLLRDLLAVEDPRGRDQARARLTTLGEVAAQRVSFTLYSPRDIAVVLHVYARAAAPAPELFRGLARRTEQLIGRFTLPQHIAVTLWSLTKLQRRGVLGLHSGLRYVVREVLARQAVEPQVLWGFRWAPIDVAQTVWAITAARQVISHVFAALARRALAPDMVRRFCPQATSSTLWAYAAARQRAPELFAALLQQAARGAERYSHRHLAGLLWAVARLQHADSACAEATEVLLRRFASVVRTVLGGPQGGVARACAAVLWSVATLRVAGEHPALLRLLDAAVAHTCRAAGAADLGQSLWGFAASREDGAGQRSFAAVMGRVAVDDQLLNAMQAGDVAQVVWAIAAARYGREALAGAAQTAVTAAADGTARGPVAAVLGERPPPTGSSASAPAPAAADTFEHDLIGGSGSSSSSSGVGPTDLRGILAEDAARPAALAWPPLPGLWIREPRGPQPPSLPPCAEEPEGEGPGAGEGAGHLRRRWSPQRGARSLLGRTLKRIAERVVHDPGTLEGFAPQHIAAVLWGFAALRLRHRRLFWALWERALRGSTLTAFGAREACTVLWAAAATAEVPLQLMRQLTGRLCSPAVLQEAAPRHLAAALWAAASTRVELPEKQFAALARQCVSAARDFSLQDAANTVWALAQLREDRWEGTEVFQALSPLVSRQSTRFTPAGAHAVLCAYSDAGQLHLLSNQTAAELRRAWARSPRRAAPAA